MKILLIILPLLLLSSCSSSTKVMTPDGKQGFSVHCYKTKTKCFELASKSCPKGYEIINEASGAASLLDPSTFDLLITCKEN